MGSGEAGRVTVGRGGRRAATVTTTPGSAHRGGAATAQRTSASHTAWKRSSFRAGAVLNFSKVIPAAIFIISFATTSSLRLVRHLTLSSGWGVSDEWRTCSAVEGPRSWGGGAVSEGASGGQRTVVLPIGHPHAERPHRHGLGREPWYLGARCGEGEYGRGTPQQQQQATYEGGARDVARHREGPSALAVLLAPAAEHAENSLLLPAFRHVRLVLLVRCPLGRLGPAEPRLLVGFLVASGATSRVAAGVARPAGVAYGGGHAGEAGAA